MTLYKVEHIFQCLAEQSVFKESYLYIVVNTWAAISKLLTKHVILQCHFFLPGLFSNCECIIHLSCHLTEHTLYMPRITLAGGILPNLNSCGQVIEIERVFFLSVISSTIWKAVRGSANAVVCIEL